MFAHMHTHTAFFPSLFCSYANSPNAKPQLTLPSNNTGFRGKLYKDPLGCSLHCETWSCSMEHQHWRGSLLWTQALSQATIPPVPCSEMRSPGKCPGRQSSTDRHSLPSPSTREDHLCSAPSGREAGEIHGTSI